MREPLTCDCIGARLQRHVPLTLAGALLLSLAGCGLQLTKSTAINTPPPHPLPDPHVVASARPVQGDPSAARLRSIAAALQLYVAVNRMMPKSLADLQSVQDLDVALDTTSPSSGQPYVYTPDGLVAPQQPQRLVIYDPTPTSDGKHWCVVTPNRAAGQAQSLDTVLMPDAMFRMYVTGGK